MCDNSLATDEIEAGQTPNGKSWHLENTCQHTVRAPSLQINTIQITQTTSDVHQHGWCVECVKYVRKNRCNNALQTAETGDWELYTPSDTYCEICGEEHSNWRNTTINATVCEHCMAIFDGLSEEITTKPSTPSPGFTNHRSSCTSCRTLRV